MGVWDLNDDIMTQHNKVAATMIYYTLLMIYILILILLASPKLSIIASFIAGLKRNPTWAVARSIFI